NNCSLSGNSADYDGGAIYNRTYSSPTLNNCSLSGNSADYDGGAIYNRTYSSPTLTNCIIWNNQASGSGDTNSASVINYSDASAPSYGYCLIQNIDLSASGNNFDGTDPGNNPLFILDVDPSLAPTTAGDLRLRTGSPAINAGDGISGFSTNTTTYDLVGNTRFVGTIDLGAYEGAYTTFANDFPALNANDDANGNGLSNYLDYAMGVDPTTIADSNSGTKLIGDRLTFNSRAYAADVRSTFKKSTDLSTWSPMVENVDYTHVQTNNNGVQDQVTIQLTNELLAEPTLFFTEEFTTE
ncbi:choice-of-anchor Q domain-containing protein, partial [Rubritalea sp.]|uniref:choice-of-anchor Q domain-containing protein n=1 Tax=Rubritalea sp. TaxID=2109375 RepID=UPI003EF222A4